MHYQINYKMTTIKTIFLALAMIVGSISFEALADEQLPVKKVNDPEEQTTSPLSFIIEEETIWYEYNSVSGVSHFILPESVESLTFTMIQLSSGFSYTGFVDSLNLDWVHPLTPGLYNIVCTAQDGSIYMGVIRI